MSHHSSRRKSRRLARQVRFWQRLVIAGSSLLGIGFLIAVLAVASSQEAQGTTFGGTMSVLVLAVLAAVFLSVVSFGAGRLAATVFNVLKLYSSYTKLREASERRPLAPAASSSARFVAH